MHIAVLASDPFSRSGGFCCSPDMVGPSGARNSCGSETSGWDLDGNHHRLVKNGSDPDMSSWSDLLSQKGDTTTCLKWFTDCFADQFSSIIVFIRTIFFHVETAIVVLVSVASPCFYHCYTPDGKALTFDLSWSIVTIAAVFPLTMTLSAVFKRREEGLVQMSHFKANAVSIFLAHRDWDWWTLSKVPSEPSTSGRSERLDSGHVAMVHGEFKRLVSVVRHFLKAPIVTRARHYFSGAGQRERDRVVDRTKLLQEEAMHRFHALSIACEELKSAGLPANEAARIRQYLTTMIAAWNKLRALKQYRTPLGLRSFARVYILAKPLMFGPYYAQLAKSTNLGFAIALSVLTTTAMQGLFNLRYSLEDPFDIEACGDAIDVSGELDELETDLDLLWRGLEPSQHSAADHDAECRATFEFQGGDFPPPACLELGVRAPTGAGVWAAQPGSNGSFFAI